MYARKPKACIFRFLEASGNQAIAKAAAVRYIGNTVDLNKKTHTGFEGSD